jgi:hypothetical protein
MKKMLATTALVGALTLTGAAAASAYPANPARGGVDSGTTNEGGTTNLTGTGMNPGETVEVTLDCAPGAGAAATSVESVVADADGSFSYTTVMNTAGQCSLVAVGAASGATVTAQVTVLGKVTSQTASVGAGQAAAGGSNDTSSSATGQAAAAGSADASSSATGLADTGLDTPIALWGAAGVGGLVFGAAALVVSRRRNSTTIS